MTTIAWSWAALLELDLEPEDVFHGTAYKGGDSSNSIDCARRGIYIGFPLLQAWEMAFDERNALLRGVKPFPHMGKWLHRLALLTIPHSNFGRFRLPSRSEKAYIFSHVPRNRRELVRL